MAELLEKIPTDTKWAITAEVNTIPLVVRGEKVIAPVLGKLKWLETESEIWDEVITLMFKDINETFSTPVEDAIGAANLARLALTLLLGPKFTAELVEASPERTVLRCTKCTLWERYKELEVDSELAVCEVAHQALWEEGLKIINPKLTHKLTKAMPRGDPYCEEVIEFKSTLMARSPKKENSMVVLLDKFPAEKRWEITTKALTRLYVLRMKKTGATLLGKGKGITALLLGREKHQEIQEKAWGEGGTHKLPWVKETFNIPVEDAIGAAKSVIVAAYLVHGPELDRKIVEATPERAVLRTTKCAWTERYEELEVDFVLQDCESGHVGWCEAGLKLINPKITYKMTKAIPRGNPYCEEVIEFKEE